MDNRIEILPDVFLTSVQTDKFKTGCFSVNLLRPMRREEASANALIPSVLLRGSERWPDIRAISARLDELYGASVGTLVRKKGEMQMTGFFADYIEDALAGEPVFSEVLDFVSHTLLHPKLENGCFRADVVRSEKRNLANAIESRINNKRSYAVSQLLGTMCAGEAYGIARLGELEDVEREDERSLFVHYNEILAHSRVEIFYMGRKTAADAAEAFREALKELPRGVCTAVGTSVVERAETVREKVETMDVAQGKLAIGLRTGCTAADEGYPALLMMNAIFGGGATSKLFTNVREQMSLCYYASASFEKFKGVLAVASGVEFSKLETAKKEILRQLEACCSGEISDYELESARGYLVSDLKIAMDSPGRLDDFYMGQILLESSATMQDLSDAIARVTKEEAAQAARALRLDTIYELQGVQA